MRIAIEAWAAAEVPAGRGRYLRELLTAWAALDDDHEVIMLGREPWTGRPRRDRWSWRTVPGRGPAWLASAAWSARDCDVLLATTSYALVGLARAAGTPTAGVVFDLVAFDRSLGAPRGAMLERLTLPVAARAATHLFCISDATRTALTKRAPRTARCSSTTWLAAGPCFEHARPDHDVEARHGIGSRYVLSAATLEPRKNLPRLIEAFAQLPPSTRSDVELVLVGGRGWRSSAIDAAIEGNLAIVRPLGQVDDHDLAALYAGATVVAYPSLEEGFGLPVLEAMAAGAPVLTSDRSSLPEVAGSAALLVDPTDVNAIRAGLELMLGDDELRVRLAAAGRARSRDFSWSTTARQTRDRLVDAVA